MTNPRIERMQRDVMVTSPGKLVAITVVAAALGFLGALAGMTSPQLIAAPAEAPAQAAAGPRSEVANSPCSGDYGNQATQPNEHIQAF
jgi:hypothetical protein